MKKLFSSLIVLTLLLTACFSTFAYDPVSDNDVTGEFNDPIFEGVIRAELSLNETEPIFKQRLEAIGLLDLRGLGISSLSGIEYCTGLIWLDCSVNELTELDLSHSTQLMAVYCYGNKISSLTLPASVSTADCHANELAAAPAGATIFLPQNSGMGDADDNGTPNEAGDALIITRAAARYDTSFTEVSRRAADVNFDGYMNALDALIILKRAVGCQ